MRLRDPFDAVEGGNDDISIPSGAIKSVFLVNAGSYTPAISIPSGAIKRGLTLSDLESVNLFQFLLVRLRALFP